MLAPFNFKKFKNRILITNDLGRYMFLSEKEFHSFVNEKSDLSDSLRQELVDNFFIIDTSTEKFIDEVIPNLRKGKAYLFSPTSLHIFVVTNYCNGKCIYCQAQSNVGNVKHMMTDEVAEKAVDIALQSPINDLNFEFQGGEPLSNFETIQHIVEYAELHKMGKNINYSIVTNLTLLKEYMIPFFRKYNISISTSLDGNEQVHDINRPLIQNLHSYKIVKSKMNELRTANVEVGAIETTTRYSLSLYKEIVDEYINCGLKTIFLRPLTPLGFAQKEWNIIGYNSDEFLEFYKNSIEYIIELNKQGFDISEGYASIFLAKMLAGYGSNYMELRSPCGASVGQIAYYFDGNIYTCDEGRMLYEMGDESFRLGNVFTHDYDALMNSKLCKTVCRYSVIESIPHCCDCAYQPYCGTCPVVNYSLEKDIITRSVSNYRCSINKGILDILFELLQDETNQEVFNKWIN